MSVVASWPLPEVNATSGLPVTTMVVAARRSDGTDEFFPASPTENAQVTTEAAIDQRDKDTDDRRRSVPEGGKELPHRRSSPECAASPRRRRIAASSPASGASIWTTSFPRSRSKTRSAWAATVGSWVTTTTV